jgi:hypothetical protein
MLSRSGKLTGEISDYIEPANASQENEGAQAADFPPNSK